MNLVLLKKKQYVPIHDLPPTTKLNSYYTLTDFIELLLYFFISLRQIDDAMHKTILLFLFLTLFSITYGQDKHASVISIESSVKTKDVNSIKTLQINAPLSWSYQANAPTIPFYKHTIEIPKKGNYAINIVFLDSILIDTIMLNLSNGLEKKYAAFSHYDTTYFIEKYSATSFFPQSNYKSNTPVIARDLRLQTFHVFPLKYNTQKQQLKIYTKFRITLIKISNEGENEQLNERNFITTKNSYSRQVPSSFLPKYQPINEVGEMLIVYRHTSDSLIHRFAHWKEQVGVRCHFLKLDDSIIFPEDIHHEITAYYDSIPDILYLLLVGDFDEIPSYLYKQFLNDDYYSDTYYGFIDGNDYVPELLVGRLSGNEAQNRIQIDKSIFYERYDIHNNYERNIMLIASDQGANIGDDNETDWEHLRGIGQYLSDSVGMIPAEYFDGSQGHLDATGDPTKDDIKDGINDGKGFIFYTGHGDFSVMNTGSFFTMHVKQLENYEELPIVISAACNHGKHIGLDCMAEVFVTNTKNDRFTGSVAFTGSTILMSWAPPMETQDEFARLMNPHSSDYKSTIGAAFYNAQLSMLEQYPTVFGEEVMQTWILFGDPSLKMRVFQKGSIQLELSGDINSQQDKLSFKINENDCLVTLSQNSHVIARGVSNNHCITFENLSLLPADKIEIVASKSNYQTFIGELNVIPENKNPFTIYPNPVTKVLKIVGMQFINAIEIVDVNGKKISFHYDSTKNSVNLESLTAGVYIVIIHTDTSVYTYKIIKTHDY